MSGAHVLSDVWSSRGLRATARPCCMGSLQLRTAPSPTASWTNTAVLAKTVQIEIQGVAVCLEARKSHQLWAVCTDTVWLERTALATQDSTRVAATSKKLPYLKPQQPCKHTPEELSTQTLSAQLPKRLILQLMYWEGRSEASLLTP
eukprot:2484710-Rhodomonas_salina.1